MLEHTNELSNIQTSFINTQIIQELGILKIRREDDNNYTYIPHMKSLLDRGCRILYRRWRSSKSDKIYGLKVSN